LENGPLGEKNGYERMILTCVTIRVQYALRTRDEWKMLRIMSGGWLWYSEC